MSPVTTRVDEPIGRVVDQRDRLLVGVERDHGGDRGEDLLAPQVGVGRDVDHDRRPVEQALRATALDDPRAGCERRVEHLLGAVALGLVDHRAEPDAVVGGIADRDRGGALGQRLDVAVEQRAGDDVAAGGDAGLALIVIRRPRADHRRVLDVGVVEHDQRVVTAELERAVLEPAAGDLGDRPAGPRRAGEVDHRDLRVGDERLADVDAARDDLQQARREPGGREHLGQQQAAADRRLGRRLQHDRVPERQRRSQHAHPEDQREVPRRDAADDAARDPLDDALSRRVVGGDDRRRGARCRARPPRTARSRRRRPRTRPCRGCSRSRAPAAWRSRRPAAGARRRRRAARRRGRRRARPPTPAGRPWRRAPRHRHRRATRRLRSRAAPGQPCREPSATRRRRGRGTPPSMKILPSHAARC